MERWKALSDRLHYRSTICPHCDACLVGPEIPKESREHYGKETNFSRIIGMSSLWYDCLYGYQCPDCGKMDLIKGREYMWDK